VAILFGTKVLKLICMALAWPTVNASIKLTQYHYRRPVRSLWLMLAA
jgi:hypothetical protein